MRVAARPQGDPGRLLASARIDPRPLAITRVTVSIAALLILDARWERIGAELEPGMTRVPWPILGARLVDVAPMIVRGLWGLGAVALLLGVGGRVAAAATAVGVGIHLGADQLHYSNSLYLLLVVLVLLSLADTGAARTPWHRQVRTIEWWPVFLLAAQGSIVYGFAAVQKLRPAALRGETLDWRLHGVLADLVSWPDLAIVLNAAGGVAEAMLAVGLWFTSTRPAAIGVGIALHLGILLFIDASPVLLAFGLTMIALYPLYRVAARPLGERYGKVTP